MAVRFLLLLSLACTAAPETPEPTDTSGSEEPLVVGMLDGRAVTLEDVDEIVDTVATSDSESIASLSSLVEQAVTDEVSRRLTALRDRMTERLASFYSTLDDDGRARLLPLLDLLGDARAVPAWVAALAWRRTTDDTSGTEDHAIAAARSLRRVAVAEGDRDRVATALGTSLERVEGERGIDNRLRIELIRALEHVGGPPAVASLGRIATRIREDQNFLINRLAVQALGTLADPASTDVLIRALFLSGPGAPHLRANDVAAEGLVRIGRPAFGPVLELLRADEHAVDPIVEQYIAAVAERDARAAETMDVRRLVIAEASYTLGAMGFAEALEPLVHMASSGHTESRLNAAIAAVRLNLDDDGRARVLEALQAVYRAFPGNDLMANMQRAQLLVAARHLFDPRALDFLFAEVSDPNRPPDQRFNAAESYALLATGPQGARLRSAIASQPERELFEERLLPMLDAAEQCDELGCWLALLERAASEENVALTKKAACMIAMLGRGSDGVIAPLIAHLDSNDVQIRLAALTALDHVAIHGSPEAVARIDELKEREEGRSIWTQFGREALPIRARLLNRAR